MIIADKRPISVQLVQTVRRMRDEARFLGDGDIDVPPRMFVGAAANPFADPFEIRVPRLAKKVAAGAEKKDQAAEGIKICVESMQRLAEVDGVRGFHIMAIDWEEKVPEIVQRAGLYPRPELS